jgi:ABC-type histidine transport system ATPase subunit
MTPNPSATQKSQEEGELSLAWFHCNECHRSFQNHNRVQEANSSLSLIKSDLVFAFGSCGHTYCINCINAHETPDTGKFTCLICRNNVKYYKIEGNVIPKRLEMYIKPPIGLIEDGLTVMMV